MSASTAIYVCEMTQASAHATARGATPARSGGADTGELDRAELKDRDAAFVSRHSDDRRTHQPLNRPVCGVDCSIVISQRPNAVIAACISASLAPFWPAFQTRSSKSGKLDG
jgi:hypothetical protein